MPFFVIEVALLGTWEWNLIDYKMKFLRVLTLVLMLLSTICSTGQSRKEMDTPNMQQAMEAYFNSNIKELEKYLLLELENNDENGYVYSRVAFYNLYRKSIVG